MVNSVWWLQGVGSNGKLRSAEGILFYVWGESHSMFDVEISKEICSFWPPCSVFCYGIVWSQLKDRLAAVRSCTRQILSFERVGWDGDGVANRENDVQLLSSAGNITVRYYQWTMHWPVTIIEQHSRICFKVQSFSTENEVNLLNTTYHSPYLC